MQQVSAVPQSLKEGQSFDQNQLTIGQNNSKIRFKEKLPRNLNFALGTIPRTLHLHIG